MGSRFKNSASRIARAYVHYREFISEWHALFGEERPTTVTRKDKDPRWYIASFVVAPTCKERIRDNNLSLKLGEFAYQLRAALDGLVWDAITYAQGPEPPAEASRIEFPILNGNDRDFDKCGFHKFPFPKNLSDWLRTIQPGTADKSSDDQDRGLQNTLEDIHNLARLDRHRRLRMVSAIPVNPSAEIQTVPLGGEIVEHEWLSCDLFDGKYDFLRLRALCPGGLVPYQMSLKTTATLEIWAEDVPRYDHGDIGVHLGRYVQAVEHVMKRFEAEFPD